MSEITTTSAPVESAPAQSNEGQIDQSQEAKPLTQAQKEKFLLTVDGEDFEEEIDFSNKEDLKKRFQLAAAAKKRMGEAVSEKRKAFEIIKAFEENPESMLARLGPKGREIAEKYLISQIKNEMLTPEEKDAMAEKSELEALRKEKAKSKEDADKSELSRKEAKYAQDYQAMIITALEKSGLPKTPALVKQVAAVMAKNLELGLELTPEDLVLEVKTDRTKDLKSIIGDMSGEQLIEFFGADIAKRIRMSDIKKLQEQQSQFTTKRPDTQSSSGSKQDSGRPMSMDEWKESINRRVNEK